MHQKDRTRIRLKMKGRRRTIALIARQRITTITTTITAYLRRTAGHKRIIAAEYNGIHQPMTGSGQPQPRDNGTSARNNEKQSQHDNNEPPSELSEQVSKPVLIKMFIFLKNGEERLITFTPTKKSCTLMEVFEQAKIPFSYDSYVQCVKTTSGEIDYFVSIDSTTRIEDMLENHPMLVGDNNRRSSAPNDVQS